MCVCVCVCVREEKAIPPVPWALLAVFMSLCSISTMGWCSPLLKTLLSNSRYLHHHQTIDLKEIVFVCPQPNI